MGCCKILSFAICAKKRLSNPSYSSLKGNFNVKHVAACTDVSNANVHISKEALFSPKKLVECSEAPETLEAE